MISTISSVCCPNGIFQSWKKKLNCSDSTVAKFNNNCPYGIQSQCSGSEYPRNVLFSFDLLLAHTGALSLWLRWRIVWMKCNKQALLHKNNKQLTKFIVWLRDLYGLTGLGDTWVWVAVMFSSTKSQHVQTYVCAFSGKRSTNIPCFLIVYVFINGCAGLFTQCMLLLLHQELFVGSKHLSKPYI